MAPCRPVGVAVLVDTAQKNRVRAESLNLKNSFAEMLLTLVPNTVAQKTTMATPDAKKLLASPYSLSSPRLCAHANRMQVTGYSDRGCDKLARGRSSCIPKGRSLTVSKTRCILQK